MSSDDEYGTDIEYDAALEETLRGVESGHPLPDIEDVGPTPSPMELFRKRGVLSVSDLVGTVWCEVQYDYRLRTKPYLPPSQRPDVITTTKGVEINVDRAKVEVKEKVLRQGEKIHTRLEREILPDVVVVTRTTREDEWGLRLITMLQSLELLLTLGKCREMPVMGFVGDVPVMGIIDEIVREPIVEVDDSKDRQTTLTDFFGGSRARTHRLLVSDSKTRASGTMPRVEDSRAGRMQVMLYKELLDALLLSPRPAGNNTEALADSPSLLPTENLSNSVFSRIFAARGVRPDEPFSDTFMAESRVLVESNGLRHGASEARTLDELVEVWHRYVSLLGLGDPRQKLGVTDDSLQLVYRYADGARGKRGSKKRRGRRRMTARKESALETNEESPQVFLLSRSEACNGEKSQKSDLPSTPPVPDGYDSDVELQRAIALSLQDGVTNGEPEFVVASLPTEVDATVPSTMEASHGVMEATQMTSSPPSGHAAGSQTQLEPKQTVSQIVTRSRSRLRTASMASLDETSDTDREREREADDNAMDYVPTAEIVDAPPGSVEIPVSSQKSSSSASAPNTQQSKQSLEDSHDAGDIIDSYRFMHSRVKLELHLHSVLGYWRGTREPLGVSLADVRRCNWCEFEDGCEWREAKALEVQQRHQATPSWQRFQSRHNSLI